MITAGITADPLGVLVAFGAGILSFVSPCVLPLVPGYVSMVSGLSAAELEAGGRAKPVPGGTGAPAGTATASAGSGAAVDTGVGDPAGGLNAGGGVAVAVRPGPEPVGEPVGGPRPLRPLLRGIGLFIAGFTVVFVALGAAASGLGQALDTHKQVLTTVSGVVVLVMGLVLLVGSLPSGFWTRAAIGPVGRIYQDRRFQLRPSALGSWAAPLMGMAFAFAWTPCIGPVLGAILALAYTRSTLSGGIVLLFAYSLGLGVPFLVTGLAFGRLTTFYARARRGLWVVHVIGGAILAAFGILLLTGQLGWLSSQFSDLLNHLGLERLTTS